MADPPAHAPIEDHPRPCMAVGCDWPGRFILGLDGGTSACWCVRHVEPEGTNWLAGFVDAVRGTLPPGFLDR